jgi:hypothetical protein
MKNATPALRAVRVLPSMGLAFAGYGWNLWPRDGTVTGNAAISDFAPDASDDAASAVPEPASLATLGAGLALVGAAAPADGRLHRIGRGYPARQCLPSRPAGFPR